MAKYTIHDPEYVATKKVDSQGRVYVGKDYTDEQVRIVIERVEEDG